MYKYPYGDSQQLNLDWIIAKIKELEAGGGADLEEVSNALISLPYNTTTAYRRYDYAFLNGKLYRCLTDTSGVFNPTAWQEALIGDDLAVLTRWINAIDAAAVVDVKFDTAGTNGKLQQKYHDQYHDVVEVDYTPVQNSKRPLSSNAGYELNGAITSVGNSLGSTDEALAIPITGNTNNTGNQIKANTFLAIKGHSTLADGGYRATTNIANGETLTSSNVEYIPDGLSNYLKYDRLVAATNTTLTTEIQNKFGNSGQVWAIMPFYATGNLFSDFPSGIGSYGAGFAVMCGYYHSVYYQSTSGDFYMGIKSYAATAWTWTKIH